MMEIQDLTFLLLMILCCLISVTKGSRSPSNGLEGVCSSEGHHCSLDDSMVAFLTQIDSLEECKKLCKDVTSCRYLTYFGKDDDENISEDDISSMRGSCALFSSCGETRPCLPASCLTLDTACSRHRSPCSTPVMGHIGDNLVSVHTKVDLEITCRQMCQDEMGCNFYSYYTMSDLYYPGTCFLLTSVEEPIKTSYSNINSDFVTGSKDCGGCLLITPGTNSPVTNVLLTEDKDVVVIGNGNLTIVAVGNGAQSRSGSGGGSGYVEYQQIAVKEGLSLNVRFNIGHGSTSVSVPNKWGGMESDLGGTQVEANNSGSSDGYSGGGGPSGNGGEDGGDGEAGGHVQGGKGSGLKLSQIPVNFFFLSPGAGGEGIFDVGGGGGGGVLVDGDGPAGDSPRDGQGYGAGGGDVGTQGMVIIECI